MKSILRNLVTGGAGFLGSHLIDKLMIKGEEVICIDNFTSGNKKNINHWQEHPNFKLIIHDITKPINIEIDKIWHFACPASPKIFKKEPIETAKTSFLGTINMLELAKANKSKILVASSSAIYGDPKKHPQTESYNGYVNSFGRRSCYEEGKRIAETLCFDYQLLYGCDLRIARIFNTYGPRMHNNDGRVICNFIVQALDNKPITIFGNGRQTRSFCYVDDLIEGLMLLMESKYIKPINLGNPSEMKILELANLIKSKINPELQLTYHSLPEDDPLQRKPSIELANRELGWNPKIPLSIGLEKTINYFKNESS
ncbi:SDR family oxidoreductase [bacterium]|nr:SDR family oxidoreductase [bacterium]